MTEFLDYLFANDKDIFDLLVSAKQRITSDVLLELAKNRGILYSNKEDREELSNRISILPHDYFDLEHIVDRREPKRRLEKTTSVRLQEDVSIDILTEAFEKYGEQAGLSEKIIQNKTGTVGIQASIEYDEYNHSKTRLLQRQRHQADFRIRVENGHTTMYFSATEKGKRIAETIKDKIERSLKKTIEEDKITLSGISDYSKRSDFFVKLASRLSGYRLKDVTSINVLSTKEIAAESQEDTDMFLEFEDNNDFDEDDDTEEELLAAVKSIALKGQNLIHSEEYQQLKKRGFVVTEITWRAEKQNLPYDIVQIYTGFDNKVRGEGFKYSVQGVFRFKNKRHKKTIEQVTDSERNILHALIEATARQTLEELLNPRNENSETDSLEDKQ